MTATLHDGWLTIPYDGHDAVIVHIGLSVGNETTWHPAFLDYADGQRVAKIRPPADVAHRSTTVWLRVGSGDAPAVSHGRYPPR